MDNPQNNPLAIVSLVLGIISILATLMSACCCCYGCAEIPFSVGALITGFIALANINADPESVGGKGLAMAGIATAGVAILINLGLIFFTLFFSAMSALTS